TEVDVAPGGNPQQCRLEARGIPHCEQLLRIRAGAARAAHPGRNVEVYLEPAVTGAAVAFPAALDGRLGGVEHLDRISHADQAPRPMPSRSRTQSARALRRPRPPSPIPPA